VVFQIVEREGAGGGEAGFEGVAVALYALVTLIQGGGGGQKRGRGG
jgi:hypothetical protein